MKKRNTTIGSAIALGISISLLGACGGSDTAATDTTAAAPTTGVSLADVCPATIVVQTDWFPESEHGGIFQLIGDDAVASKDSGAVVGSLVVNGLPTGVKLEIRAGGPFLESPVVTEMYQDNAITFGYVGTDVAITRYNDAPTLAVFNALNINPQVVLWDATKHPEAKTIADAAKTIKTFYVYGDPAWMRYFEAQGLIQKDQVDSNYKGNLLLSTEDAAHQGFATSEPYKYANLESGAITTGYQLIHDAGWNSYAQNLAIRKDRLEELRPCLEKIVPIFQQAQLDYIADPTRANAIILTTVATYDSWWTQTEGDVASGALAQKEMGIVGNGDTPTFGDLEDARVNDFIAKATPILREQGLEIADITASDITDNEFLDSSITYKG
ncbi:MAG: ABC transporter substrate-binding protein [Actinomycetota bacterium]